MGADQADLYRPPLCFDKRAASASAKFAGAPRRFISIRRGDCQFGKAGGVGEEPSLEFEDAVRTRGDDVDEIGFISAGAIGGGGFGAAVGMRMETADDASLAAAQFPHKRELHFRIDQETPRRIVGD